MIDLILDGLWWNDPGYDALSLDDLIREDLIWGVLI